MSPSKASKAYENGRRDGIERATRVVQASIFRYDCEARDAEAVSFQNRADILRARVRVLQELLRDIVAAGKR